MMELTADSSIEFCRCHPIKRTCGSALGSRVCRWMGTIESGEVTSKRFNPIRAVPIGSDIFGPCRQSSESSCLYAPVPYDRAYSTTAYDLQTGGQDLQFRR